MTVDFAEILPTVRWQGLLAAGERDAAEQEEIARGNRDDGACAELGEKSRAADRPVKQNEQAETEHKNSAEKEQDHDGSKMGHEDGHFRFSSGLKFREPGDDARTIPRFRVSFCRKRDSSPAPLGMTNFCGLASENLVRLSRRGRRARRRECVRDAQTLRARLRCRRRSR